MITGTLARIAEVEPEGYPRALLQTLDIGLLALGGALLAVGAVGAVRLLLLVPMGRPLRTLITRAAPVAGLVLALGYLGFVLRVLFRGVADRPLGQLSVVYVLLGLLLVALVAVSWDAIRNFFSGVVLKAGGVVQVGDVLRVGQVHGRVLRLGQRALVIESADGAEALMPFTDVARGLVHRTKVSRGASPHVFKLTLPTGADLPTVKQTIRDAAVRCHWASPVREAKIRVDDDGTLEITVFALHADYGPDVEAVVRRAAGQLTTTAPLQALDNALPRSGRQT